MTTDRPLPLLVVGAGGLLGRALVRLAAAQPDKLEVIVPPPIQWRTDAAEADLTDTIERFAAVVADRPWSVAWCAGAGIIGTGEDELAAETDLLRHLLRLLPSADRGMVFLSSSAGGVYGGIGRQPISEQTSPDPISVYGENKLRQEQLVATWATETGGRAVIGRISNLYGPGQRLSKPQGLISHLALSVIRRQPVGIFVSLDTIRDYLFVDDAACQLVRLIDHARHLAAGTTHLKIIASMRSASIGSVLGEVERVAGRRPTVILSRNRMADAQGSVLSFRSVAPPDVSCCVRTTLPAGIDSVLSDLRMRSASGELAGGVR